MAHVLLEWPPSISKPDSPSNEATKKPGRAVLDRVFIPYCLDVFAQSLPGKPTISKKSATSLRRDPFDPAGLNPVRRCVRSRTSSGGGQQAPRKAQHLLRPPGRRAALPTSCRSSWAECPCSSTRHYRSDSAKLRSHPSPQ